MRIYTVTLQHASYSHIREMFPVYAASLDDARNIAYRQCGQWFFVSNVQ